MSTLGAGTLGSGTLGEPVSVGVVVGSVSAPVGIFVALLPQIGIVSSTSPAPAGSFAGSTAAGGTLSAQVPSAVGVFSARLAVVELVTTSVALGNTLGHVYTVPKLLTDSFATTTTILPASYYVLREVLTFATTHSSMLTAKSLLTSAVDTDGALGVKWDHTLATSAAFTNSLSSAYGRLLQSIAVLGTPTTSKLTAGSVLASAMVFTGELARYWVDTLSSSTAVTGPVVSGHQHVAALIDAMVASDSGLTHHTAKSVLADAMATLTLLQVAPLEALTSSAALSTMVSGLWQAGGILADAVALANASKEWWGPSALCTDSVGTAGAASNLANAFNSVLSSLVAADTAVLSFRVVRVCADTVALSDTPASLMTALQEQNDEVTLYTTFRIGDEVFRGYVLNAANKAASEYVGFSFNSMAVLGEDTLLASPDGLFRMTGDTDAGTSIDAHVRTGLMAVAGGKMAQVISAYIGYTSDGEVVLKAIITSRGGEKREHWYKLTDQNAVDTREGRVKLGLGLKSVYWQFELTNVDGSTLDVDNIQLHSIALDRRI